MKQILIIAFLLITYFSNGQSDDLNNFLAQNKILIDQGGKWKTINPDYKKEDTLSAQYFGYEFSQGIHPHQLKLNITGYFPYHSTWKFIWQGTFTWNANTKKVDYHSINNAGSLAKGSSDVITPTSLGLLFSVSQKNGTEEWHKDVHTVQSEKLVSTSFTKNKKKWMSGGTMIWTRLEKPEGTLVFMSNRDGNFEMYTMNANGENLVNITCNRATEYGFTQGPDGKIAFYSNRDGNNEVYTMDVDGKNQTNITKNPASDRITAISPDGKKIVFSSDRHHKSGELYLMNIDGSDVIRLTNNENFEDAPNWSPDGKKIIFARDLKGSNDTSHTVSNGEIFIMNADGTDQKRLTDKPGFDGGATFSPDGKKIAFYGPTDQKNYEIFLMNTDGTEIENITNDVMEDYSPAWSPDGKWIGYTKGNSKNYDVWIMNLDTKIKYRLTSQPKRDESPFWLITK